MSTVWAKWIIYAFVKAAAIAKLSHNHTNLHTKSAIALYPVEFAATDWLCQSHITYH